MCMVLGQVDINGLYIIIYLIIHVLYIVRHMLCQRFVRYIDDITQLPDVNHHVFTQKFTLWVT